MRIDFTENGNNDLLYMKKNNPAVYKSVYRKILELSENKITGEAIKGYPGFLRVKVGKYRLGYVIIDGELLIIGMLIKRSESYLKKNLDTAYKKLIIESMP